jgi:hypothetical protein
LGERALIIGFDQRLNLKRFLAGGFQLGVPLRGEATGHNHHSGRELLDPLSSHHYNSAFRVKIQIQESWE